MNKSVASRPFKKPFNVRFGNRLKEARKKKYKTQQLFADFLGVDVGTVSKWERGDDQHTDYETLVKIADDLGCDIDYLFGRIDAPTHDIKHVSEVTGLSEECVTKLIKWNNAGDLEKCFSSILSDIIVHRRSYSFFAELSLLDLHKEFITVSNDYLSSRYSDKADKKLTEEISKLEDSINASLWKASTIFNDMLLELFFLDYYRFSKRVKGKSK